MKKEDVLAYILFSSLMCNGSQVVAEITRIIEDRTFPHRIELNPVELNANFKDFFETLCFLGDQMFFKSIGSCRNPRHTVTSGGREYKFCDHKKDLLEDLDLIRNIPRKHTDEIKKATIELMEVKIQNKDKSCSRYNGIGPVVAHNYVQLCSLCGLLPLQCYQHAATINQKLSAKTGPNKFLSKCLSFEQIDKTGKSQHIDLTSVNGLSSHIFERVFRSYNDIWKGRMRKDWYENTLCELNRVIESSLAKESRTSAEIGKLFENINLMSVVDENGSTKDNIFIYQGRSQNRQIQAQFKLHFISTLPILQMNYHMITREGEHCIEKISLTSWEETGHLGNTDPRQQIKWQKDDTLFVSEQISSIFETNSVDPCFYRCENDCCTSEGLKKLKKNKFSKISPPVNVTPKDPFDNGSIVTAMHSKRRIKCDIFPDKETLPVHCPVDYRERYQYYLAKTNKMSAIDDEEIEIDLKLLRKKQKKVGAYLK